MEYAINSIYTARKSFPQYPKGSGKATQDREYYVREGEKFQILSYKNKLYSCYSLELGHRDLTWFEVSGLELDYILRQGETK